MQHTIRFLLWLIHYRGLDEEKQQELMQTLEDRVV
jgi:hypothetical protein